MPNYKFEVIEKIGAGAFGEVYKVKDDGGARHAIKIVFTNSEDDANEVMKEIRVHVGFNHGNIVKCDGFDFISSRDNHIIEVKRAFPYRAWVILMELCDSNLREQLRRRLSIDFTLTASYFRDILNGVNYFHSQKVIHRDLKPENILAKFINGKCIFKISDFGLGKPVDTLSPVNVSAIRGTPLYMAPEQGKGEGITMKVDVYSLGIILMELYTLEPIDQWINWINGPMDVMELINTLNTYIKNNRKDVPGEIHNLITRMTEIDPKDRPDCAKIVAEFASLQHQ